MLTTTDGKCPYRPATLSNAHTSSLLIRVTTLEMHSSDLPEKCSGPIVSGHFARNRGLPEIAAPEVACVASLGTWLRCPVPMLHLSNIEGLWKLRHTGLVAQQLWPSAR